MHDIKTIRDNPQAFDAALKRRGLEPMSASLLAIDEKRRAAILASEQAQARRNSASKECQTYPIEPSRMTTIARNRPNSASALERGNDKSSDSVMSAAAAGRNRASAGEPPKISLGAIRNMNTQPRPATSTPPCTRTRDDQTPSRISKIATAAMKTASAWR